MRIAILDDYQHTALSCADWGALGAEVVTFDNHIAQTAELAATLAPFDVIVAMRERTPFTAERIGLLPNLRLLVTTGMRHDRVRAARSDPRGPLLAALHAGKIAGAAVDVYDEEPLPIGHPLRSAPRTVLTPHLGYVTEDGYRLFYTGAVEDIAAFASGRPVRVLE